MSQAPHLLCSGGTTQTQTGNSAGARYDIRTAEVGLKIKNPLPTFLDGLEGVVGFDELDGVSDLLALQDVIVQAEVRDGQLKDLIVPRGVLLEDGACGRRKRKVNGAQMQKLTTERSIGHVICSDETRRNEIFCSFGRNVGP